MSAVVFLLIAVAIAVVGSFVAFLRTRNRNPASVESGIDDFRREMQALAPRPDPSEREIWDT